MYARWSALEIVQKLCSKLNHARPAGLTTANLTADPMLVDLVEVMNDTAQKLVLRLWPDELDTDYIVSSGYGTELDFLHTTDDNIVSVNKTTIPSDIDAELDDDPTPYEIGISGLGNFNVLSVTEALGSKFFTLDRAIDLDVDAYATTVGYLGRRKVALPTTFHKPHGNIIFLDTDGDIEVINPTRYEALRNSGSIDARLISMGKPRFARIVKDSSSVSHLYLYNMPDQVYPLNVPAVMLMPSFTSAADDDGSDFYYPVPAQHQHIIIDACLQEIFGTSKFNIDTYKVHADKYSNSLTAIAAEDDLSRDATEIIPVVRRGRRRMFRGRRAPYPRDFDRED